MLKNLLKLNDKLITFFENPIVKYGFLILVVLQIIFICQIPMIYLSYYENIWAKVLIALLIAYSACFDPVYAIALTTLMIISIQEVQRRKALSGMKKMVESSNTIKQFASPTPFVESVGPNSMPNETIKISDEIVYKTINQHALQKTPDPSDTLIGEYDYYRDPAFQTLTENVSEQNTLRNGSFYITDDDLGRAQTNVVDANMLNVPMQAFSEELNAQGIPNGFDKEMNPINSKTLYYTKNY